MRQIIQVGGRFCQLKRKNKKRKINHKQRKIGKEEEKDDDDNNNYNNDINSIYSVSFKEHIGSWEIS